MGNSTNRQFCRIWLVAIAIFACALVLPASSLAVSSRGTTRVTVRVEDSVGVGYGDTVTDLGSTNQHAQVLTQIITRDGAKTGRAGEIGGATGPATEILITVSDL